MTDPPLDAVRGPAAPPGRLGSPPRGERGGISWVTLLLLLGLSGCGYGLWVWAPIYFENYTVKQVVRDYLNQAVKNRDDDGLRHNMVLKIRSLSQRDEVDAYGKVSHVPSVQLDERDVTWERDMRSQPPMLRVAFEYERQVEWPGLERVTTKVFVVDLSNDLTVPDWGPPR
jgi:hypothetical protein